MILSKWVCSTLLSACFVHLAIQPAQATTYKQYTAALDECFKIKDKLDRAGCIADAAAEYVKEKIPKFFSVVPMPLDLNNILVSSLDDVVPGSTFALNVFSLSDVIVEPSGIDSFNQGVGVPTTPVGPLHVFIGLFANLVNLDANQGIWTTAGTFTPGGSDWSVNLNTSGLDSNASYVVAFTPESNPSLFSPDAATGATPMGFTVVETVPEPGTLSLLVLGGLGLSVFLCVVNARTRRLVSGTPRPLT
jgi:hypothetical protein